MKVLVRRSQHTRWNGVPKRKYMDANSAAVAAQRMRDVTEQCFDFYVCGECDEYHVGHTRGPSVAANIDLAIELDERVLAHLKAENIGSQAKRLLVVKRRVQSAWRVAIKRVA